MRRTMVRMRGARPVMREGLGKDRLLALFRIFRMRCSLDAFLRDLLALRNAQRLVQAALVHGLGDTLKRLLRRLSTNEGLRRRTGCHRHGLCHASAFAAHFTLLAIQGMPMRLPGRAVLLDVMRPSMTRESLVILVELVMMRAVVRIGLGRHVPFRVMDGAPGAALVIAQMAMSLAVVGMLDRPVSAMMLDSERAFALKPLAHRHTLMLIDSAFRLLAHARSPMIIADEAAGAQITFEHTLRKVICEYRGLCCTRLFDGMTLDYLSVVADLLEHELVLDLDPAIDRDVVPKRPETSVAELDCLQSI